MDRRAETGHAFRTAQIARIKRLLPWNRTRPIETESAETQDQLYNTNYNTFAKWMGHPEIHRGILINSFADTLKSIDRVLFEGKEGSQAVGWRNKHAQDVHVGKYLPPAYENVPELMELFAQKLDEARSCLTTDEKRLPIAAWAAWMLINIHPKRDGNGRLSQALASYLVPEREILSFISPDWHRIFSVSDPMLAEAVAQKTGAPMVDIPPPPDKDQVALERWKKENVPKLRAFYRPNGQDMPAELLKGWIENTKVVDGKFVPSSVSQEALDRFVIYLKSAPARV